jgi:radical SAM protein with 4Fe4S-binding SPASM domain
MKKRFVGIRPQYIDKRNNKYLLIWPEIPNWLVADKELFKIIKMFDSKTPIDEIIEKSTRNISKNEINKILSQLIEVGVVFDSEKGIQFKESEAKLEDVCIHPTLRCNLRCKMCYNKNIIPSEKELSIEEIKDFLDQTKDYISDKCCLSILGGEPILTPNKTLETAEYARELGFKWRIMSTNGTLITKDFARRAKDIELEIQVSLDSANEEENDRLRGKGSFKKALDGTKILVEEGTYAVLGMTYHSGNFNNLEEFYDLALELGVDEARFAPLKYIGGGGNNAVQKIPLDEMLKYAYKMFKNNPHYLSLAGRDHFSSFAASCKLGSRTYYCGTGSRMVLLNSDGDIYPCINHNLPEFKAGNIREKSFSEIWNNSPILNKLRETYPVNKINENCSKCAVRHWCLGGCRGETYHVTRSLNSCAIDCINIKKAVIEMFWMLSGEPDLS